MFRLRSPLFDSKIKRGTEFSAGYDIASNENNSIGIGQRKLINTGLFIEHIPDCSYLRIAPRSGLSLKGIDIGGGVIDQDYRGEIKIIIINNGISTFIINEGDFIAQIIPEQISNLPILLNKKMIVSYSERKGGFGSTDK